MPVPSRPSDGFFLVYAPGTPHATPQSSSVAAVGLGPWLLRLEPRNAVLRLANGIETVSGLAMRLPDALIALAAMTEAQPGEPRRTRPRPASIRGWSAASKLALELAGRESFVPTVRLDDRRVVRAVWSATFPDEHDRERRDAIAAALPPSAFATVADPTARPAAAYRPARLIEVFCDAVADSLIRNVAMLAARSRAARATSEGSGSWEERLVRALTARDNALFAGSSADSALAAGMSAWTAPLLGAVSLPVRTCFVLGEPPDENGREWTLEYRLQAAEDPSIMIPAAAVFASRGKALVLPSGISVPRAEEILLRGLAEAARLSVAVERSLNTREPSGTTLSTSEAWEFLSRTAPVLAQAGFGLLLPRGLEHAGKKRLRARIRVSGGVTEAPESRADQPPSATARGAALDLKAIAEYHWEIALGDDALSPEEFRAIAAMHEPLVRWRGQWVAVDPADLERGRLLLEKGAGSLSAGAALAAIVTGEAELLPGEKVEVVADGDLSGIAEWLRSAAAGVEIPEPAGFLGELRPYQRRGLGWLAAMESHGVGACLADDMGLGKTVQLIALALERPAPTLLICPTSVVGNWERELARFGPSLPVVRHHGITRARSTQEMLAKFKPNVIVVTSYALARRDERILGELPWKRIALDEAQAIKNASSRQSKAVRGLVAKAAASGATVSRLALTGTPVENRLGELWSILDFLNPGLLGTADGFRRRYAIPIERLADDKVAGTLKKLVQPFVLRRMKSDPLVQSALPEKNEMTVICTLTREQATLYQAEVDQAMKAISEAGGLKRRGRILALITALKQICNHPSQFAKDDSPLTGRSGKLARLTAMVEEALAGGERVLIFSQFRKMGDRLVRALSDTFGDEPLFLHGGVPALARDEMVERFQAEGGPRIFVLSLKAGGFGLNLTAATQVFHFDRWWNPAVEDQATNRAHRIGQTKNVSVWKLITAGTLEERIDKLLESKRALADRVLGTGERWLTEMTDDELKVLVQLSPDTIADAEETEDDDEPTAEIREAR